MPSRSVTLVLSCWLVAGGPASAHELTIDEVEQQLQRATARLARLAQPSAEGMLSEDEVHHHFEVALADHLLGEHTRAAERFYALEPFVADPGLRDEVQWYRAESLLAADLPTLAEQALDSILANPAHPYHPQALSEALRLAGDQRQTSRLLALAETSADASHRPAALNYTIGRAWLQLGDPARAGVALSAVPDDHPDYPRAQYVLGASHTAAGRIAEAEAAFAQAMCPTASRAVSDRARLALARLAHHRGALDEAAGHYAMLDFHSGLLPEALHELAWVYVAADRPLAAVATIEHFLAAFPDHEAAGSLGAARGRLLHRAGEDLRAEEAYAAVEAIHMPLIEALETASTEQAASWVMGAAAPPEAVPAWAQERLARPVDVRASVAHRADLHDAQLALSEGVALSAALAAVDPVAVQAALERQAVADVLLAVAKGLLAASEARLGAPSAPGASRELRSHHQALALAVDEAEAGSHDLPSLRALLGHLEEHRQEVREACADSHHDLSTQRLDDLVASLHDSQHQAEGWLTTPRPISPPGWSVQLAQCTGDLDDAVVDARRLEQAVGHTLEVAVDRAVSDTRAEADKQLESALAGLADVTWTRLTATGDARAELISAREAQVFALEEVFDVTSAR